MAKSNKKEIEKQDGIENVSLNQNVVEENQEVVSNEILYKVKVRKTDPKFTKKDIPVKQKTVFVSSRLPHTVNVAYGDSSISIPPKGKVYDLNPEKLGILPKGIDISQIK